MYSAVSFEKFSQRGNYDHHNQFIKTFISLPKGKFIVPLSELQNLLLSREFLPIVVRGNHDWAVGEIMIGLYQGFSAVVLMTFWT